jgi:hypothetical protein
MSKKQMIRILKEFIKETEIHKENINKYVPGYEFIIDYINIDKVKIVLEELEK